MCLHGRTQFVWIPLSRYKRNQTNHIKGGLGTKGGVTIGRCPPMRHLVGKVYGTVYTFANFLAYRPRTLRCYKSSNHTHYISITDIGIVVGKRKMLLRVKYSLGH